MKKKSKKSEKSEIRSLPNGRFEIRADSDGNKTVSGYLAVYGQRSVDLGFTEVIAPGAFTASLKNNPDVRLLLQHDWSKPLARTASGTLQLRDDSTGLGFTASLPDTTYANDLAESISRGDISGCSFGFFCNNDSWETDSTGKAIRTLLAVTLSEGSIVTAPAYPQTSVSLRSCPAALRSLLGDLSDYLIDDDDSDDDDVDEDGKKKKKSESSDDDDSGDSDDDDETDVERSIRKIAHDAGDCEADVLAVVLAKRRARY